MPPVSLAGTVDESKAKRQERLISRFRDRGGIFVPSEGNALVDILLLRGVNGESPVKKRTPRKKSTRTPKTRPPAAASRVAGSKTPRAGAPKRASRKPAAAPRDADENDPPLAKKRRNTSKRAKLSEGRRTPGMDTGPCAGPSRLLTTAQRAPFADQLADAINCVNTRTAPDSSPASKKVKPSATTAPPPLGKSERAVGKRNAQAAAALPPPHPAELEPSGPVSEGTARKVKSPLFLLLEKRQREKHDDQRRVGGVAAAPSELAKSFAPHESDGGESDDSDAPLAMKLDKRAPAVAESRTKLNKGKGNAPQPPTKRRSKAKALERGVGLPDEAANRGETIAPPKAKKGSAAAEERAADPGTVALAVGKVARDVDADLPPPPPTHTGANSGVRKKVQVLQEKTAPANAPRKRKERIKTLLEPSAKDEHEHEPSRKKSRRADPSTSSRSAIENREMSRTAREAASIVTDKPLPSPVKRPATRPKPAKVKKAASSRAGSAQAPRSRGSGLPRDVLRRIKVHAQALPALDEIDDDDPIDFLRS